MILNSHNSLFAHIFFNSHFIRYQRLKEQGASSYGHSTDAFSALLKSPQKFISSSFLPENQLPILKYVAWRTPKWEIGGRDGEWYGVMKFGAKIMRLRAKLRQRYKKIATVYKTLVAI